MPKENLKIIAIGGQTPDGKVSSLLEFGLELTGRESKPKVLVIPTAKETQERHDAILAWTNRLFVEQMGAQAAVLHDFNRMPTESIVDELLEWADLVYMAGGDTKRMMEIWQKYGVDTKLQMRAYGGLVLTGISSGAIAPFAWGHSDWEHYYSDEDNWQYQPVEALGLINAAITPHNNTTTHQTLLRETSFAAMFAQEAASRNTQIGIGIDNFAGINIHNGQLELRVATTDAGATLIDSRKGQTLISRLDANQPIRLEELGL